MRYSTKALGIFSLSFSVGLFLYWTIFLISNFLRITRFGIEMSNVNSTTGIVGAVCVALFSLGIIMIRSKPNKTLMLVRNPKGKVVYIHQAENGKAKGKANYVLPELNSNKRTPQFGKSVKGSYVTWIIFLTLPIIGYALMAAMMGTYLPFMAVSSQSMQPTLNQGDLIILGGAQAENIELGDIIAFNVPSPYDRLAPSPTVHRVVEKWTEDEELFFVTKGDNNINNDMWKIPADNLVGKYSESRIPYIGFIVIFLKSPLGLTLLVMILATFFVYDHFKKKDE